MKILDYFSYFLPFISAYFQITPLLFSFPLLPGLFLLSLHLPRPFFPCTDFNDHILYFSGLSNLAFKARYNHIQLQKNVD